jgi:hypothetical protein
MERITNINPQRLAWCCADAGVAADEVAAETGIRAWTTSAGMRLHRRS